jgi:GTP pyrophosphokinase
MRTLDSLATNKQMKIASETIYLYAPLAHRLGLYAIKTELEDLSLKYRFPQAYDEIRNKIADNEKRRIQQINHFSLPIIKKTRREQYRFRNKWPTKIGIFNMEENPNKNVSFEEIYDLLAIRIVFNPILTFQKNAMLAYLLNYHGHIQA